MVAFNFMISQEQHFLGFSSVLLLSFCIVQLHHILTCLAIAFSNINDNNVVTTSIKQGFCVGRGQFSRFKIQCFCVQVRKHDC